MAKTGDEPVNGVFPIEAISRSEMRKVAIANPYMGCNGGGGSHVARQQSICKSCPNWKATTSLGDAITLPALNDVLAVTQNTFIVFRKNAEPLRTR